MGFDDLFDGFDDIIGDKNKGGSSPEGQKEDDSWGEEKHWNTGKGEDIWRSASPDAVWNSGQPARHTDTSPKPDDSEDDEVYEEDDEGYEEEDDYDDEDDDGGLDLDF